MRRFLPPLVIALAVVAGLVWAFWPRPLTVEVAQVMRQPLAVQIEEEGTARISEVFTLSAPIGGKLTRISLDPGDPVMERETVVAQIGPVVPALLDDRARAVAQAGLDAAKAAVDLAQAQLAQAEASRDFARTEANRARALFDRQTVSQQARDAALLAEASAEAALASAEANLAVRERERDSAQAVLEGGGEGGLGGCCVRLTAPVSGRVLRVLTEDEQVVQPGTPLIEIGNPGKLEITVDLLSRDAVRLAPGAAAEIVDWGGPPLAARVARIDPAAETKVSALGIEEQRVEVVLRLSGPRSDWQGLGHGFRVVARIDVWRAQDVLTVPVGALFRDGSDWAAFSMQEGRAVLRRLQLGERNAAFAQVLDGLTEGETVIVHPPDTLVEEGRVVAAELGG